MKELVLSLLFLFHQNKPVRELPGAVELKYYSLSDIYPERISFSVNLENQCQHIKGKEYRSNDRYLLSHDEGTVGFASFGLSGTSEEDNWFKYKNEASENQVKVTILDMDSKPFERYQIDHADGKIHLPLLEAKNGDHFQYGNVWIILKLI